jgi:hypothetical protein
MKRYWNRFLNWLIPNLRQKILEDMMRKDQEDGLYNAYKNYKNAVAEVGLFDNLLTQKEFVNKIKTNDTFAKQWRER